MIFIYKRKNMIKNEFNENYLYKQWNNFYMFI